jgi:glycosyltransferase involved in cell wall biosynthesis
MKIIVLGTRGIPNVQGGVETHCEELFPRLVKRGCHVELITRKPYIDRERRKKAYGGVKLKHLYAPKKRSVEAIIHSILGVIYARTRNPDIIHIHAIGPSLVVPLAKLLGLKVITTNHGPDYDRQKWGKIAKLVLKIGEKFGAKYSDKIIVISTVIQNNLRELYKRYDTDLIYNGVNIPNISDKCDYLKELGVEKRKYIFTAGRFVPEKGFHDLIKAYEMIKSKEYKLVISGDSDHPSQYRDELNKMAKENGVILTGFIKGEKLQQLFSHAALFVLPSYHEGLPIALLEAMSYNLRVLVSNIPANKAVNLDYKHYFSVGNIQQLSVKIDKIINSKFKTNYQDLIKKKYNWDIIAQKTFNVYKSLL